MSLETWISEFYSNPASEDSEEEAALTVVSRSLTKWQGLHKTNLEDHGVVLVKHGHTVHVVGQDDGQSVPITGETCHLCKKFDCRKCPVAIEGGQCDQERSPYTAFRLDPMHNPWPMLGLLYRIRDHLLIDPTYYDDKEWEEEEDRKVLEPFDREHLGCILGDD